MLKSIEDVSSTRKRLKIEIPAEAFEAEIKAELEKLKQKTRVPGFRPGKAPVALLEKRYGREVEAEAMEKVISTTYATAVKEAAIRPVSSPVFEHADTFKRHVPFNMTVLVDVMPRIEGLSYEGIAVKDIPVSVEDADIEQTLKRLQEEKTVYEPTDGPLADGDLAIIDYQTDVGMSANDRPFKLGTEMMPKEFTDRLIGLKKDGTVDFPIDFPESYYLKELAGKRIEFKVTVKDTKKASLPAIDDEFAKDMGFDDLTALKTHIKERLLHSKRDAVASIQKAEIMKKIMDAHPFDAPESLVDGEISRLINDARTKGNNDDSETLKAALKTSAERHTKASLVIQAIGEKEGIAVSEEEIQNKVAWLSERMSLSPENVLRYYATRDGSLDGLRHSIFEDKVLDLLLKKAVIEEAA